MEKNLMRSLEDAAKAIVDRAFESCCTSEQVKQAAANATYIIEGISREAGRLGVITAYEQGLFITFAKGYLHKCHHKVAEEVSKRLVVEVFV